jgi:hypothetical protein
MYENYVLISKKRRTFITKANSSCIKASKAVPVTGLGGL